MAKQVQRAFFPHPYIVSISHRYVTKHDTSGLGWAHFPTWEEAHAHLIVTVEKRYAQALKELESAKRQLKKVHAMQKPEGGRT